MRLRLALLGAALAAPVSGQTPGAPRYRYPNAPIEERVRGLIGRMTLEEKFWQLYMTPGDLDDPAHDWSRGAFGLQIAAPAGADARAHASRINAIQRSFVERTRLGIPIIPFEEAVHGLVAPGATMFPQAIAIAATWDTALVGRVAAAIAKETLTRGIRQVLSPVVNLASDVRWGRTEETYGEDPLLASAVAAAFTGAFARAGLIATPKHFVANVGDGGRDSYPVDLSDRALEERFFPPFRAAIRAGAGSVMTAYNSVDGVPATQNRWLLTETLRQDWQFPGFAFEAGLDVVFQSSWPQHRPYLDAFRRGLIPDSVTNQAVARVLRAKFALGLFERPYADPDSAAYWNGHAEHLALAGEAARGSIVLLRNEGDVLPLDSGIRSLAVIGADAAEARLGGYSGPGVRKVSMLEALRARLSPARVRYAPGPGRSSSTTVVIPGSWLSTMADGRQVLGLRGEYFPNPELEGTPALVRTDPEVSFLWTFNAPGQAIPRDWYSVRWTGSLTVPPDGKPVHRIGIEGNDGFRLWLDGKLLLDHWRKQSSRTLLAEVMLVPGSTHEIRLEYFETAGNVRLKLVWDPGEDAGSQAIEAAIGAARASDAAIVVAGIEEGEFRDRAFLQLPGRQEELILRLAQTGKPVVVVLVGGSAVTMSRWIDRVAGVLQVWYPGEQGGPAVADVLFGDHNPAGRLPITFPMAEGQLPLVYNHKPTGRGDDYLDLSGKPLFPFGFGLSYTTFEYAGLAIEPATIGSAGTALVRCRVRNTGMRAGDEVVQLYLQDRVASVAQPVIRLAGFQRVRLAPGQEREVGFRLGPQQLRLLDRNLRWVVEPGAFQVLVGASSADIRLRGELNVQ
ncbi:MAG: glycoside hydrolase family 3 C-terminal domain-containing protein [Gemmatimonadales bacterium]